MEFVDDGFSGTSLNRPAFKRMMADVKVGTIRNIIVKDLSRFMRDYLELGNYLENIFPFQDYKEGLMTRETYMEKRQNLDNSIMEIEE